MEYAEDNLSQILPQRALTPAEVRDLLEPTLDVLTFIHGRSLVHSRLKPSNVLAAQDQLKLSSDSLLRSGEAAGGVAAPSEYDAPEIANGDILPASDVWSLGMTIMEALTQRLPACEGIAEPLPETVPAPFMGIAHCCLRLDPQRRCGVADIATRLQSGPPAAPQPSTVRIPAASAKSRYILLIAVVVLAIGAVVIGPRLLTRRPAQSAGSVSSAPLSAEPAVPHSSQSAPPETEPAPNAIETKPSAIRPRNEGKISRAAAPTVFPAASPNVPAAASVGRGGVLRQVTPVVSRSAQNTITGTIRVRVKVLVDSSGNVGNAALITAGPSKYFAGKAVEAAQQWKFAPAAPGAWILHFGFKRSGTELDSEPAKP
jgi:TonB family protein